MRNPVAPGYIDEYLPYLMTSAKRPGEDYTYGQYLESQIEEVIRMYQEKGPGTNQAYMAIGNQFSILGKLYHGDCLEIMPELEPVDLVLTDPPYGIKRDKGFKGFKGFGGFGKKIARRRFEDDEWDSERPSKKCFYQIAISAKRSIIFGGNFFADILPQSTHWLVWDKLNTMPTFGDCELAWTNIPRKSVKKYTVEYNGLIGKEKLRVHPTQKPLQLFLKILVDYSKEPTDTVIDPFLGSGTTAVACERLQRKWIGIEISEKYCEIAAKRIEMEAQQLKLFAPEAHNQPLHRTSR